MELHYINLSSRIDRRERMEHQLREYVLHIPYYRHEAVSPSFSTFYTLHQRHWITDEQYIQILTNQSNQITRGSIGCFLSHLELLQYAVTHQKILMILEDDVHLKPNFESSIMTMMQSITDDEYDMIYIEQPLGHWKDSSSEYNEYLYRIQRGYSGTFAYIIHPRHAAYVLDQTNRIQNHIDNWYLTVNAKKNIFLFKEHVLSTDVSSQRDSDVMISLKQRRTRKRQQCLIPFTFYFSCTSVEQKDKIHDILPYWKQYFPNMKVVWWEGEEDIDSMSYGFLIKKPIYPLFDISSFLIYNDDRTNVELSGICFETIRDFEARFSDDTVPFSSSPSLLLLPDRIYPILFCDINKTKSFHTVGHSKG